MDSSTDEAPMTIGKLYKQDLKTAYILPHMPTTFAQHKYFLNDKKYYIYLYPNSGLYPSYLRNCAERICRVAGKEFPILMDKHILSDTLMSHWEKWLPEFPDSKFKKVDEGMEDQTPIITVFPMQRIPADKHAVQPDMHYKILLKSTIPEIGALCPKHFTKYDAVFPCIVKQDQSASAFGNYQVHNQEELDNALKSIHEASGKEASYVITEFIENVEETLGCQFYLNKKGEVRWIGTCVNVFKECIWTGNAVDWDLQDCYRQRVYDSFVVPVANYLQTMGYFGIIGIDVITSPSGDYLVDLNARITGFTAHALIAPVMARHGLTKSLLRTIERPDYSTEDLINKANFTNETSLGKIIILCSVDEGEGCMAVVLIFHEMMDCVDNLLTALQDE